MAVRRVLNSAFRNIVRRLPVSGRFAIQPHLAKTGLLETLKPEALSKLPGLGPSLLTGKPFCHRGIIGLDGNINPAGLIFEMDQLTTPPKDDSFHTELKKGDLEWWYFQLNSRLSGGKAGEDNIQIIFQTVELQTGKVKPQVNIQFHIPFHWAAQDERQGDIIHLEFSGNFTAEKEEDFHGLPDQCQVAIGGDNQITTDYADPQFPLYEVKSKVTGVAHLKIHQEGLRKALQKALSKKGVEIRAEADFPEIVEAINKSGKTSKFSGVEIFDPEQNLTREFLRAACQSAPQIGLPEWIGQELQKQEENPQFSLDLILRLKDKKNIMRGWKPGTNAIIKNSKDGRHNSWNPPAPCTKGSCEMLLSSPVFKGGERAYTFEGLGYHDHNWGTMDPQKAITEWAWGGDNIADPQGRIFSLIWADAALRPRYGLCPDTVDNLKHIKLLMLARNGQLFHSSVGNITFKNRGEEQIGQLGLTYPKIMRITSTVAGEELTIFLRAKKAIVFQKDLTEDFHPILRWFIRAFIARPGYVRLLADTVIKYRDSDHQLHKVKGVTTYELMVIDNYLNYPEFFWQYLKEISHNFWDKIKPPAPHSSLPK